MEFNSEMSGNNKHHMVIVFNYILYILPLITNNKYHMVIVFNYILYILPLQ